jgi:NhaP-type Na+/H+ or K+/H+ antiporter
MWWAGLRGAIAFASAASFPSQHREVLLNVTAWICLVTIFAMGPTTPAILRKLKIPFNVSDEDEDKAGGAAAGNSDGDMARAARRCDVAERALHATDAFICRVIYGPALYSALLAIDAAENAAEQARRQASELSRSTERALADAAPCAAPEITMIASPLRRDASAAFPVDETVSTPNAAWRAEAREDEAVRVVSWG